MKYLTGLLIILSVLIAPSCIKHEVIPAPTPKVDLLASFRATYEGSSYELIKDVDGFYCEATQDQLILSSPQSSKVTYYSAIKSAQKTDFIKIGIGQLNYDAAVNSTPSISAFEAFFNNNTSPSFKTDALGGVEILYRDANGGVWVSDESSTLQQDFTFTSLSQESDEMGDYMKFTAKFNVSLVDDIVTPTDTVVFQNAIFEGYFQR